MNDHTEDRGLGWSERAERDADKARGQMAVEVLLARVDDGVHRLEGLKQYSGDPGACHIRADQILLEFVPPKVKAAFEKLRGDVTFWYD